jgi:hypothetical protein
MGEHDLFLGDDLNDGSRIGLDADHLTTHAVCLGMTGSGKTGLGIVALEELARRGVPLLVVDLKGDMVNLLLSFPSLEPSDFEPWLTDDMVAGRDRAAVAAEQATLWRDGLERSGLGSADVAAVRDGVRWQLLTPGAGGVAPVDILPSLAAPPTTGLDGDPDGSTERAVGVAGALLSLVGRGGDPLTDRDHVLVSTILIDHWRRGEDLDLARLLADIADPAMDTLGVLPLDRFYPRDDRLKLVTELNALVASPAFAPWTTGVPLAMESLLGDAGDPRASIVSIAHLDDRQRAFFLSLLASELVAWMRRLPGTSALRALLYIDELQGILPPHPANPPTKTPILTILKQGRAFGVGAWLATQNPVDIDYKALGNAGVTLVGRLVTERDRDRVLDGLGLRTTADGQNADQIVSSLGKREFLLHDVRASARTRTLRSRWAMSYLRGPVTLAEMRALVASGEPVAARGRAAAARPAAADGRKSPPVLGTDVEQRFAATREGQARPSLVVAARVTVTRSTIGLERTADEVWQIPVDHDGELNWDAAVALDEPPVVRDRAPDGMEFPAAVSGRLDGELKRVHPDFIAWRAGTSVEVLANRSLGICADADEHRASFEARCLELADRSDDDAQEKARARYRKRMDVLRRRLDNERLELEGDRAEARSRKAEEVFGVVESLFSVLLGSKSARSAGRKAASRARAATTRRRMSQRADADVDESLSEIERIERELEQLAAEMESEVDRIAEESEAKARTIESVGVRPRKNDISVTELYLLWE